MCIFHKWGKWTQYESTAIKYFYGVAFLSSSINQTRTCERCGYSEDEYLSSKDIVKLKHAEVVGDDK